MTLRDLIHKVLRMPDYISEIPDDPTHKPPDIMTSDGDILTDIWVRGDDVIIIDIKKKEDDESKI